MESFLEKNIRHMVHMRHRLHVDNRLGLCVGAGVSADFDIPTWKKLIQRIAEHPAIEGSELLRVSESLTSQSQYLYQRYLQRNAAQARPDDDEIVMSRRVSMGWLRIIQECLYKTAKIAEADLKAHPYLWNLLPLIKQSVMTINYNFDDTLERMLYLHNKEIPNGIDDRGFEVVWQPTVQFRRNKGVIYHPNGFLPLQTVDGLSEQIVFMEQEFADQLVDVGIGHYTSLLNHFAQQTIIFVGLSLSDTNLKHLLRISARNHPGNFHYHIHWCPDQKPNAAEQEAIRRANFSIYNLVTLFLSTEEIREMAAILVADRDEFRTRCDDRPDGVRTEYRYFLTGPVGSGKTTTLEQIHSIATFDEWVDRKHELLARPSGELLDAERASVDTWINMQFRRKNRRVDAAREIIALIDRSPLDPLYFVAHEKAMAKRAHELITWMVPTNGGVGRITGGHLIVFRCDPRVLRIRLASRDKTYTEEQLAPQISVIEGTWRGYPATFIDTTNMSPSQVVSKVLEVILFSEYKPIDFHQICVDKAAPQV